METRKKKVLIHSNFCKAFTGFGKHKKNLLKYLYKTGKYEIVELANAKSKNDDSLNKLPWKALGTLPTDPKIIKQLHKDQTRARNAGYGHELIDNIIKEEQPDIYLGIEDIWAFSGFTKRNWWNKINCVIQTTLDSLPLLPEAIEAAPKIKNYFVWASFAEKEMKKMGFNHVKTIRGIVEHNNFYRLEDSERQNLRSINKLKDEFIVGFVFRNQLRKSVPNLLDGFQLFLKQNPKSKGKLLLHTHWGEGWDIKRLLDEKKIDNSLILTTYFCSSCKQYEIRSFEGNQLDCPKCNSKKTFSTTNIKAGVNENQLNEIYNLMDVYCHPFTSGGQEIPIQEAKLTELITLVTNYSCGEDCCTNESGGFPLDWAEYREPGTQFIKASTSATSIAKNITKVFKMDAAQKSKMGKKARQFVIDNYSTNVVGKMFEDFFDSLPFIDWSAFDLTSVQERDPNYVPNSDLSNSDWLIDLYKNMLRMDVDDKDSGYQYWMAQFAKGGQREGVYNYFKQVAQKENRDLVQKKALKDVIDFDRPNKRIAYVMPLHFEDVFMSTSIVTSIKKVYPDHDIYFFTKQEYFNLVDECEAIHKLCEYEEGMDESLYLEGKANEEGYFDISYTPFWETKKIMNYTHNGLDKIELQLK